MKFTSYKPKEIEPVILNFWKHNNILEKLKDRNKSGKKYYFLQGPPYTSGRIHIGHAWNNSMKDMVLRYKRMNNFNVWDRGGYDMHGLPTEHATEKKLGIKGQDQIKAFGVENFVKECEALCIKNMEVMNKDLHRLGVWMDHENAYQSISNDFIDGEWWLIKRAYEQGRLYEGLRTMHWDTASSTGVAKHELEYKAVTDKSVYLKFPLRDEPNTFFLIWTTTPWTLPLNLAIMAHPDFTYVKAKVGNEIWIIVKSLAKQVIKEIVGNDFQVIQEIKGSDLENIRYAHPFEKQIKYPKSPKLHSVVLSSEYVDDVIGTGLVHCAPGCGPEDYEVGYRNGLMPFNTVDEKGVMQNTGPFTGLTARKDDVQFAGLFDEQGFLIASKNYRHDYPHDLRSKEPVIFRTTKQWFFKVEDLKEKMIAANNGIKWIPEAGYNAFNSWLQNLRDNSISKQRFWGTPLPIWRNVNDENDVVVVGSIRELESLSGKKVHNPHKPWIDEITIVKNGKTYRRIPDVLDVWVDAGTASWNSLYYPCRQDLFEQYFPADFILEGKDQIRGWFNLLMVASFLALDRPSFKAVYMHGFVTDVEGVKMSKSLGNIIPPDEVIEKYGADTLRYYSAQTKAGEDMNFSWDDLAVSNRNLNVLWNLHRLLINLAAENNINPFQLDAKLMQNCLDIEEKYIFSCMHKAIKHVTEAYDNYHVDEVIKPAEDLYLELSRTYIQLVRDKSSIGSQQDKEVVIFTLANVLLGNLKLLAPVIPFAAEAMYQNMREQFKLEKKSLHFYDWPCWDERLIDEMLEQKMSIAKDIISAGLHVREQIRLNVRWPVKEALVTSTSQNIAESVQMFESIIKSQLNVKQLHVRPSLTEAKDSFKVDFARLNKRYSGLMPQLVARLAQDKSILSSVESSGEYSLFINGQKVTITLDDLMKQTEIPYPYRANTFRLGNVYLNEERTEELDAEGYSRELVRRIQELRKKAGLQKPDRILLYIKVTEELKVLLLEFVTDMQARVGAEKIKIDALNPVRKHDVKSTEKIRDKEFGIYFDKLS